MPYISEIVTLINATLTETFKDGSRFIKDIKGVSELVPRNNADDQNTIPVLVNTSDFKEFSGVDDRWSLQIYHRVLSVEQVETPISYGDGNENAREQANMRLVCFADRKRTKLDPYQMAFMIRSSLNNQYLGTTIEDYSGLMGATIEADQDNYNSVEVWQNEYNLPAENYPVQLHQILISIDYTITTDYNKTCITSCLEC